MGPIGPIRLMRQPSGPTNHFSLLTSHFSLLTSRREAPPVDNRCKAPHSSVMKFDVGRVVRRSWAPWLVGAAAIALLTIVCAQLHTLSSVPALLFMVVIVVISLQGRFVPAIFISLVAIVCLDYWFIKPGFTLASEWTLDVVGLVAYLTTAIVITSLLARVRQSFRELRRSEARLAEGGRLSRTGSWTWTVSNRENVYLSAGHFRVFRFDPDKKPVAYT